MGVWSCRLRQCALQSSKIRWLRENRILIEVGETRLEAAARACHVKKRVSKVGDISAGVALGSYWWLTMVASMTCKDGRVKLDLEDW